MKTIHLEMIKLASFAGVALMMATLEAHAASISTPNIFNPGNGGTVATVNANSGYDPTGSFPYAAVDDLTSAAFVFGDYERSVGSTAPLDQLMSISGFSAPSGIDTLVFFDASSYEPGRVPSQVTIYTSTGDTASLDTANYTPLNGGEVYALGNASGIDTLSDLGIAAGTQSILLDFGDENYGHSSDDYHVGAELNEIQAFAPLPEPSTYAMLFGGLGMLVLVSRLRSKLNA